MYQLYSLQTCPHCHEAVELMRKNNIQFEQINAGSSDGIDKFRKVYTEHRNEIKRDNSGTIVLPIILSQDNGNLRIHQGTEGLERFLGI
ncbi:MAG: hypothetical protein NTU63_04265 [Candidatus Pacearchaeota archaeon]|nr:hypothetical protein [Candidatus Pacearchaeota archaeon]